MSDVAGAVEALLKLLGRHPLMFLFALSATLAFACLAPLGPLEEFQASALCGPALVVAAACAFLFLAVAASKLAEVPLRRARFDLGLRAALDTLPAAQLRLLREAYESGGSTRVRIEDDDARMLCGTGMASMPAVTYSDTVPLALAPEVAAHLRRTGAKCFERLQP